MIRLLVCGGRNYMDEECVYKGLDRIRDEHLLSSANCLGKMNDDDYDVIISGASKGADSIAIEYANTYGLRLDTYPADWKSYGRKAGFIRNTKMLKEGKPDLVAAFPGGKGTKMMIDLAQKACVPVIHIERDPLGNIVMGAKGSSSSMATSEYGIKTRLFQQKYIERLSELKILTPGQRDGLYQEIAQEEIMWLANQDAATVEYEEILRAMDMVESLGKPNE